ncbi:Ciao3 [Symbiodinium sp. CCMP2592]|nr:Ciao3 [Symbiodinium sp. CCMP2592]
MARSPAIDLPKSSTVLGGRVRIAMRLGTAWEVSEALQSIDQYTEGVEFESYSCTRTNVDDQCVEWQGDISSLEEVEWTKCQAVDSTLHRLGAVWICDEWELPKTRELFHESNIGIVITFVFFEVALVCCLVKSCDEDGDALFVTTALSWITGLCLLPFLVITLGFYGFLFAGGIFWVGRCCCCGALCVMNMKMPEFKRAEQPSNRVRMQRGASKILGRQTSSVLPKSVILRDPQSQEVLLRFTAAYGFRNIQNVIRRITKGSSDGKEIGHFVEIMACPGGCLNGGGQIAPEKKPVEEDPDTKASSQVMRRQRLQNLEQTLAEGDGTAYVHPSEHPLVLPIYRYIVSQASGDCRDVPLEGLVGSVGARSWLSTEWKSLKVDSDGKDVVSSSVLKW